MPLADVVGTFSALVDEGAIAANGPSNDSAARATEALEVAEREAYAAPVALQPQYSLVHRSDVEAGGLARVAVEAGLAIAPYYALASGFLTGKYRRGEPPTGARATRVAAYATEAGFVVLDALTAVAAETGSTPTAVALAWLRGRPGVAAPIASATGPEQVATLLDGARLRLDPAQADRLTRASQPFA